MQNNTSSPNSLQYQMILNNLTAVEQLTEGSIQSIQNFLSEDTRNNYQMIDVNVYQENIFHTKMLLKNFAFNNYIFGSGEDEFSVQEKKEIELHLKREMLEIFYGRNMTK